MSSRIRGDLESSILRQGQWTKEWLKANLVHRIAHPVDMTLRVVDHDPIAKIHLSVETIGGNGVLKLIHNEAGRTLAVQEFGLQGRLQGIGAGGRMVSAFMHFAAHCGARTVVLTAGNADGPPFWHAHGWNFGQPERVTSWVKNRVAKLGSLPKHTADMVMHGLHENGSAYLRRLCEDRSVHNGRRLSSLLFEGLQTPCQFDMRNETQRSILTEKLGECPFPSAMV